MEVVWVVLEWCDLCVDFEIFLDCLEIYFGELSLVYVVNNMFVIVMLFMFGNMDFDCLMCLVVMVGLDIDLYIVIVGLIVGVVWGKVWFGGIF